MIKSPAVFATVVSLPTRGHSSPFLDMNYVVKSNVLTAETLQEAGCQLETSSLVLSTPPAPIVAHLIYLSSVTAVFVQSTGTVKSTQQWQVVVDLIQPVPQSIPRGHLK
jgi:hypothetical protein